MNQELHTTRERSDDQVGHPWMLAISLALLGIFVATTVLVANAMEAKNNWQVLIMLAFDFLCLAFVVASFHRPSQSRDMTTRSNQVRVPQAEREKLEERRQLWSRILFPGATLAPFIFTFLGVLVLKDRPDWIQAVVIVVILSIVSLAVVLWRHRVALSALRRLK